MSPKLHEEDGYRFYCYSNENDEPPHVHVVRGDSSAKLWLTPVDWEYHEGFRPAQRRRILEIVTEHLDEFIQAFHASRPSPPAPSPRRRRPR